jgi:transposase-like protein
VYDEGAKGELVARCGRPGTSVSWLVREAGLNANLGRRVREYGESQRAIAVAKPAALVSVPIECASKQTSCDSPQASILLPSLPAPRTPGMTAVS